MANYWVRNYLLQCLKFGISIFLFALPSLALAELQWTTLPSTEVVPGEIVMAAASIKNETTVSYPLEIAYPEEWLRLCPQDLNETVLPFSFDILLPSFQIPHNMPKGEYFLSVRLGNESLEATVRVASVQNLVFDAGFLTTVAPAGEKMSLRWSCRNEGNIPVSFVLDTDFDPIAYRLGELKAYSILPGQFIEEELEIQTAVSCFRETTQVVHLLFRDACSGENIFKQSCVIDLLPCNTEEADPWLYMQGFQRLFSVGTEGQTAVGYEVAGRGPLDPEGLRQMDFFVTLPTNSRCNLYNMYQRLYAGYTDPETRIVVGDTSYVLTPLTERWRYGRGVGIDYTVDNVNYGSFYVQNRLCHDRIKEGGAYIGYDWNDCAYGSLQYFKKAQYDCPKGEIVSLQLETGCACPHYAAAEYAYDAGHNRRDGDRHAYRAEYRGKWLQDTYFYAEKYYAGRGFFGYYNAANYYSAGLDTPLDAATRLCLGFNNVNNFANHHCCYRNNFTQRNYNGRLSYTPCAGTSLAVTGLLLQGSNFSKDCNYDFSQGWGGLQCASTFGPFFFYSTAEWGRQRDHITRHVSRGLQRYNIDTEWMAKDNLWIRLHFESGSTNYFDADYWRYSIGGSCLWKYACPSYLELFCRSINERYPCSEVSGRVMHLMGKLSHMFENGHHLGIRADGFISRDLHPDKRWNPFNSQYEFLITYTVPFETPTVRRCDFGSLSGYLYDADTFEPIPNAIVDLGGERVLTNNEGCYRFSAVAPGQYAIQTQLLPRNTVGVESNPKEMCIEGGRDSYAHFAVVQTGRISGMVTRYEWDLSPFSPDPVLVEAPLTSSLKILIEKDCGEEIYTIQTDPLGRFAFDRLRPGRWRVTIDSSTIPDHFYLETEETQFVLQSDEEKCLQFKILPKTYVIMR